MQSVQTEQRYKFVGAARTVLPSGQDLLRSQVTGHCCILTKEAVFATTRATSFATLAEHAASAQQAWPGAARPIDLWTKDLNESAARGLLLSETDASGRIRRALTHQRAPAQIDWMAIPTQNRPTTLRRLLTDVGERSGAFSRELNVLVIDDSTTAEARAENLQVVRDCRDLPSVRIWHLDRDGRRRCAAELAKRTGVPEEIVRFGMSESEGFPITAGSGRNTALLLTAGHPLVSIDDDVRYKLAAVPKSDDRILVGAANAAFETWYPQDPSCPAWEVGTKDLIRLHEEALNLDGTLLSASPALDQPEVTGRFLKHIDRAGARVLVSFLGVLGDSATDSALPQFLQSQQSLSRLTRTKSVYQQALDDFRVFRGPQHRILSEEIAGVGYCIGIDNSALLPPYIPVQRGEEIVFFELINRCCPGALSAASPWAVLHEPPPGRVRPPMTSMALLGTTTLMTIIVGAIPLPNLSAEELIPLAGARIRELTLLSDTELRKHLHGMTEPTLVRWIQQLDKATHNSPGAGFLTGDASRMRDSLVIAWNHADFSVPADLLAQWGPDRGRQQFRNLLRNFAALLESWPTLVAGARELGGIRGFTEMARSAQLGA